MSIRKALSSSVPLSSGVHYGGRLKATQRTLFHAPSPSSTSSSSPSSSTSSSSPSSSTSSSSPSSSTSSLSPSSSTSSLSPSSSTSSLSPCSSAFLLVPLSSVVSRHIRTIAASPCPRVKAAPPAESGRRFPPRPSSFSLRCRLLSSGPPCPRPCTSSRSFSSLSRPRCADAAPTASRASSTAPSADSSAAVLLRSFESRYGGLRREDRLKMLAQKRKEILDPTPLPWERFRSVNLDADLAGQRAEEKRREERRASRRDEVERDKPAHLRRQKVKSKRLRQEEDDEQYITSANFSEPVELLSLAEDLHKAEIYVQTTEKLEQQWPAAGGVARGVQGDQFFDVMAAAVREDLQDQSRPVLVNELTDLENPYSMKREALRRLVLHSCTRNCLDETLGSGKANAPGSGLGQTSKGFPNRQAQLSPVSVLAGVSFATLSRRTRFSIDAPIFRDYEAKRTRLNQKATAVQRALRQMSVDDGVNAANQPEGQAGSKMATDKVEAILSVLPENFPSDELHPLHPFRNHFGFETAVPHGVVGSISMGKGRKKIEKELSRLRYPTLQRVAHSLPKDLKYRESVAHAIRVLERSRGWDFESKVKAINALVEVWNRLAPGRTYEQILNHAFPVFR
ncbi:conserved hypothetical protein [Neospora caninum Liverpool]|uniref:Uncharacterized protein n=1 Tax=Neospora caninum (strain Liverpool) TaxID=572307 RepID=F0VKF5_NEOCL|nr:conserved hypothetical protein [Neospora caninum Liverpool]CBZ54556.1 conserved hypothetical protein [Neospora caninum Liverpool]|eukprot:XP_003884586.1 conserved hypothetical protein [Neospora caninum Liverpool]